MIEPKINFESFIGRLIDVVPEIKPVYDEHLRDYDTMLEHVFMGDVTRFAKQLYTSDHGSAVLRRLLAFLNRSYSAGDRDLENLISVSFLENLSQNDETYVGLRSLLSAALLDELKQYEKERN